jgi:hypothetical protein
VHEVRTKNKVGMGWMDERDRKSDKIVLKKDRKLKNLNPSDERFT